MPPRTFCAAGVAECCTRPWLQQWTMICVKLVAQVDTVSFSPLPARTGSRRLVQRPCAFRSQAGPVRDGGPHTSRHTAPLPMRQMAGDLHAPTTPASHEQHAALHTAHHAHFHPATAEDDHSSAQVGEPPSSFAELWAVWAGLACPCASSNRRTVLGERSTPSSLPDPCCWGLPLAHSWRYCWR